MASHVHVFFVNFIAIKFYSNKIYKVNFIAIKFTKTAVSFHFNSH